MDDYEAFFREHEDPLHRKIGLLHPGIEPLRQRSGFQPDPPWLKAKRIEPGNQCLRLACNLAFTNDLAGRVHNANA